MAQEPGQGIASRISQATPPLPPPSMPQKIRPRGAPWSTQETRDFIDLWGLNEVQRRLSESYRNESTFQWLSDRMIERGHHRDLQQCRDRAKELKRGFKAIKTKDLTSGAGKRSTPYFAQLERFLCIRNNQVHSRLQGSGKRPAYRRRSSRIRALSSRALGTALATSLGHEITSGIRVDPSQQLTCPGKLLESKTGMEEMEISQSEPPAPAALFLSQNSLPGSDPIPEQSASTFLRFRLADLHEDTTQGDMPPRLPSALGLPVGEAASSNADTTIHDRSPFPDELPPSSDSNLSSNTARKEAQRARRRRERLGAAMGLVEAAESVASDFKKTLLEIASREAERRQQDRRFQEEQNSLLLQAIRESSEVCCVALRDSDELMAGLMQQHRLLLERIAGALESRPSSFPHPSPERHSVTTQTASGEQDAEPESGSTAQALA
ncbi:uncharacterized protein LOC128341707 [Hemicordylus capensis]|uniref:uncharacterized protein LOC128341707 n=1 Tax=Hemicordylus capensis TaxID=884348 RepID=UPI00230301A0|nr:uncharacterized protein LOC128341707 [Hemicordylus capensis]XP_053144109.1 uncharacterized protein LOC128341707 [Hemicordylus capensis]